MHPTTLTQLVASAQSRDRIVAAAQAIAAASGPGAARGDDAAAPGARGADLPVAIRRARPADAAGLERLAELDGRGHAFAHAARGWAADPELTVLLAEVGGAPAAAVVLPGGTVVADPFTESGELVRLLQLRAEQLRRAGQGRSTGAAALRALLPSRG